jgi:hypothetical protein
VNRLYWFIWIFQKYIFINSPGFNSIKALFCISNRSILYGSNRVLPLRYMSVKYKRLF